MLEFLLIPLIAGLFIAITAGALGSFVVWRKMSYFGDTLAHASLLGLAIGFALQINLYVTLIVSCVVISMLLVALQRKNDIAMDTLLGIIAHSSLSFTLVAISFIDNLRIDLMGYLFGDLLSITPQDLAWIAAACLLTCTLLFRFWHAFLAITISEDMAKVDGYPIEKLKLLLIVIIALVIAVAMKFVGALIITSLMIIPAATAKRFANNPEQMALGASMVGALAVVSGIGMSWYQNTPAGPSVVVAAALMFFVTRIKKA